MLALFHAYYCDRVHIITDGFRYLLSILDGRIPISWHKNPDRFEFYDRLTLLSRLVLFAHFNIRSRGISAVEVFGDIISFYVAYINPSTIYIFSWLLLLCDKCCVVTLYIIEGVELFGHKVSSKINTCMQNLI